MINLLRCLLFTFSPARKIDNMLIMQQYFEFQLNEKTIHVKTHKLLQVCKQVVTNLFTSCQQVVFALLVPSCCNKFGTGC
jgi:hypothetical protein